MSHDPVSASAAERPEAPALLITDEAPRSTKTLDELGVRWLARSAPAAETRHSAFLREWVARGYAGEMAYIGRRVAERVDPRRVLDGARSIVALGFVYDPGARSGAAPATGLVARSG